MSILLATVSGCVLKKRRPPVPQQTQAPTITAPIADSIPEAAETTPPPPPPAPPATEEAGKKTKPRHSAKKTTPPPQPPPPQAQSQTQKPGRVVIQEGGAQQPEGTLSASLGAEESTHQRQSTAQLLDSTQNNLRSINRQLTAEEQAMVAQIKDYMEQSLKATRDSDPVRARNLALKAHLLSDELVRR
ncbi:MAG: hypothetical protein JO187_04815 [Acidobacteria bacterium]|nr:hypothetical protein [Acidobacteriota bacterium]